MYMYMSLYYIFHYHFLLDDSGYSTDGSVGSYDFCDMDSDAGSVSSLINTQLKILTRIDNLRNMIQEVRIHINLPSVPQPGCTY